MNINIFGMFDSFFNFLANTSFGRFYRMVKSYHLLRLEGIKLNAISYDENGKMIFVFENLMANDSGFLSNDDLEYIAGLNSPVSLNSPSYLSDLNFVEAN
jgi:hypothetical protein